jgi:hypothetical protein
LAIEDAGNDGVGVVLGKTAYELNDILVGANGRWARTWQRHINLSE